MTDKELKGKLNAIAEKQKHLKNIAETKDAHESYEDVDPLMENFENPSLVEEYFNGLPYRLAAQHKINMDHAVIEALANAGIPPRYTRNVVFDTSSKWMQKLNALKERVGTGFIIVLLGDRGVGKTQMAVELIRYSCAGKHDKLPSSNQARYMRMTEFFMSIRECYRKDGPSEKYQIRPFISTKLLVLDDCHEASDTPWENRMLSYLIDCRYGEQVDTIMVSNNTLEGFRESVSPSIYSRIVETGGIIECHWESFRK